MSGISYRVTGVDEGKCEACGMCVKVCPHGNYEIVEKNGKIVSQLKDVEHCDRCGLCLKYCDSSAIKVSQHTDKRVHEVNTDACTACEQCVLVCPHGNFEIIQEKERYVARIIDKGKCLGERRCEFVCTSNAIKFRRF